ncbi:SusC/RagA family TonB-linked outer membrane protein [Mucinivorans hirudinis]|uniref:SusC/RagA family TonB-linked outer membrane protein n=1 Tax=Mucinivorans hirudinis TaxID=1433126 RepID=A0A060R6R3_9BACT|nr:SusC/RagA family TonB-linked outer membrane protein [Mucinivorans hirudinis]
MRHITQPIRAAVFTLALVVALPWALYASDYQRDPQLASAGEQQKIDVRVLVVEDGGTPVIGATVVLVGDNSKAELTDVNGIAILKNVPGDGTLEVSYVGMKTVKIPINGNIELTVKLTVDAIGMQEVVVVGFGTQRKVNLTGAVSVVKSTQLESRPVNNVGQALQGMIPGLNISTGGLGGELNNAPSINIRGGGTIGAGSSGNVLVLIDGMEGDMNAINPQDIESISTLKDAAASSIYGSRAPFGVILITTKRGKAGKVTVNYNNNFRWTSPLLTPNMMDSKTFAEYFNLAAKESGQGAVFSPYTMQKIEDYQAGKIDRNIQTESSNPLGANDSWKNYENSWGNNDWFATMYKKWVFSQEHHLAISGGSDKVQYFISGNVLDQNGLLRFSGDKYGRKSFAAKISAELAPWIKISSNSRLVREDYDRASYQAGLFYHNIARRWPTLPLNYPKVKEWDNPNYGNWNEIEQLRAGGRDKNEKDWIYQQIALNINPAQGWNINLEGNVRQTTNFKQLEVLPMYMMQPNGNITLWSWDAQASFVAGQTRVNSSAWKENFYTANLYTDYTMSLENGHNLKLLLGINTETSAHRDVSASGDGLITPKTPTVSNTSTQPAVSGSFADWATLGIFARVNYNYKDRYLVELNARYDGSSRFLSDQRWKLFPSFSAGWNVASEEFMGGVLWLNTLKIRGSWGQLGNQNTEYPYPFYTSMPSNKNYGWLINGNKPPLHVNAPGLVSSLLTWETVQSWNVGVDFALFNGRLNGTFDVYERVTHNMIGPAPALPGILGVDVPQTNNCDLQNRGWELELSWRDRIQSIGLDYGIRVNISDNVRKVTRYPNPTNSIIDKDGRWNQWYSGRLAGEIWGYTTLGIAQTQAEMDAHLAKVNQSQIGSNWQAGDIMYADLTGNGEINGGEGTLGKTGDRRIIGNSTPRYSYGINADFSWKGIDLQIFIQGIGKRDYAPAGPYMWGAHDGMWQSAGFVSHLDFWRSSTAQNTNPTGDNYNYFGANPDGFLPRLSWDSDKNKQIQTRYLQDASYMRLKNIQVGYTLPRSFTEKFGCSKLRIYISGDNLLTFCNMISTFDPETIADATGGWSDGKVYPLSKVISGGLSITF